MDVKKILAYQNKEAQILSLEKKLMQNKNRIEANKAVQALKNAQEARNNLESQAKDILDNYTKYKKAVDENWEKFENLRKTNLESLPINKVKELKKVTKVLASNFAFLEKKLSFEAEEIGRVLNAFDASTKKINAAKENYDMYKKKFEVVVADSKSEIEVLREEFAQLAKGIDKKVLANYNAKRADKIFPIYVPLSNNMCGGCGMELPLAQVDKLKTNGILECENCHKIIYVE